VPKSDGGSDFLSERGLIIGVQQRLSDPEHSQAVKRLISSADRCSNTSPEATICTSDGAHSFSYKMSDEQTDELCQMMAQEFRYQLVYPTVYEILGEYVRLCMVISEQTEKASSPRVMPNLLNILQKVQGALSGVNQPGYDLTVNVLKTVLLHVNGRADSFYRFVWPGIVMPLSKAADLTASLQHNLHESAPGIIAHANLKFITDHYTSRRIWCMPVNILPVAVTSASQLPDTSWTYIGSFDSSCKEKSVSIRSVTEIVADLRVRVSTAEASVASKRPCLILVSKLEETPKAAESASVPLRTPEANSRPETSAKDIVTQSPFVENHQPSRWQVLFIGGLLFISAFLFARLLAYFRT